MVVHSSACVMTVQLSTSWNCSQTIEPGYYCVSR